MAESTENTFTAYLGPDFQQRLMWQLLVEPEFAEKILPNLAVEYFEDPNLKRLFIIILEYYKEYEKVPNLQNQSIQQAIFQFKTPNNQIEEESLFSVIKKIQLWNERIINKELLYDGVAIQKSTTTFIKQQEWRKFAEFVLEKTKNGEIRRKQTLGEIDERLVKISHIGDEEDDGTQVIDNIDKALRKEFRETIPTGVDVIDVLTGGGLGKGEIGVILTPSGVGKTTLLTKIANSAYDLKKNVAQIIFEDTTEQIQRKHYALWSGVPLSKMDDEEENKKANKLVHEKAEELRKKGGVLMIKKFSQENTTMLDIRNWMIKHQKKYGIKFDLLVLDYLDCLESHKKTPDRTEAELQVIKSFEALAADFDIPGWTAIQSNRSGFDAEYVEANQTGGSIKRVQKAHFFMSVAKTKDQKEASLANIRIIKARFAQDGQSFQNCIFNNDTMEIRIEDERYKSAKLSKYTKHHDESDVERIENEADKLHGEICKKLDEIGVDDELDGAKVGDFIVTDIEKEVSNNVESINKKDDYFEIDNTVDFHPEKEFHEKQILNDAEVGNPVKVNTPEELRKIAEHEILPDLGWTGESFNVNVIQNEVKVEDLKPPEPVPEEKIIPKIIPEKKEFMNLPDPDEQQNAHNSVYEMLRKARLNQGDIRIEEKK